MKNFVTAIIVAAGNSTRMGRGISKQFIPLLDMPVIAHTLTAFQNTQSVDEIVLVARPCDEDKMKNIASEFNISKLRAVVHGGETRGESVQNGVNASSGETTFFAIHDGARPLIRQQDIEKVVNRAFAVKCAALGVAVKDTVKSVNSENIVTDTPDRASLRAVQTPQVFEKGLYLGALEMAVEQNKNFTDDCQLIENAGGTVEIVQGSESNIKITTPYDLIVAESILKSRKGGENI